MIRFASYEYFVRKSRTFRDVSQHLQALKGGALSKGGRLAVYNALEDRLVYPEAREELSQRLARQPFAIASAKHAKFASCLRTQTPIPTILIPDSVCFDEVAADLVERSFGGS